MKGDRPSSTALLIARSLVFMAKDPRIGPLIPPEAAATTRRFLESASAQDRLLLRLGDLSVFRSLVWALERATLPGMLLHYAVRKLYLEELAREALAEGYRQVVALGAGFDTLAFRLGREYPDARFLEVDHPATQSPKRRALQVEGELPNLRLLPVDLADVPLERALPAWDAFDRDCPTLFIAEGVLMYLHDADVRAVFRFCAEHGGAKPRVAFTFMERLDGRIAFRNQRRVIDFWLRWKQEPFRWGVPKNGIPSLLRQWGFEARSIADRNGLRERYLTTPELRRLPLADGDHVCLAQGL